MSSNRKARSRPTPGGFLPERDRNHLRAARRAPGPLECHAGQFAAGQAPRPRPMPRPARSFTPIWLRLIPTGLDLEGTAPLTLLALPAPVNFEEPQIDWLAAAFRDIAQQIQAGQLAGASRLISEVFDIKPSHARRAAGFCARQLATDPGMAARLQSNFRDRSMTPANIRRPRCWASVSSFRRSRPFRWSAPCGCGGSTPARRNNPR